MDSLVILTQGMGLEGRPEGLQGGAILLLSVSLLLRNPHPQQTCGLELSVTCESTFNTWLAKGEMTQKELIKILLRDWMWVLGVSLLLCA